MERNVATATSHSHALLRAARAMLGWSLLEASRRAEVSVASVVAWEGKDARSASARNPDVLRRVYVEAGVEFLSEGEHLIGIRITDRFTPQAVPRA